MPRFLSPSVCFFRFCIRSVLEQACGYNAATMFFNLINAPPLSAVPRGRCFSLRGTLRTIIASHKGISCRVDTFLHPLCLLLSLPSGYASNLRANDKRDKNGPGRFYSCLPLAVVVRRCPTFFMRSVLNGSSSFWNASNAGNVHPGILISICLGKRREAS